MTLESMYDEVADFRNRFKKALVEADDKEVRSIVGDVIKKTSSVYEESIIMENLKEVYAEHLDEILLNQKGA